MPVIFVSYLYFGRSYIRSDVSFKYLAAILDAILDFSKCSRVTGCHITDPQRGHLPEHFYSKKYCAYSKVKLCINTVLYTSLAGCRTKRASPVLRLGIFFKVKNLISRFVSENGRLLCKDKHHQGLGKSNCVYSLY